MNKFWGLSGAAGRKIGAGDRAKGWGEIGVRMGSGEILGLEGGAA